MTQPTLDQLAASLVSELQAARERMTALDRKELAKLEKKYNAALGEIVRALYFAARMPTTASVIANHGGLVSDKLRELAAK